MRVSYFSCKLLCFSWELPILLGNLVPTFFFFHSSEVVFFFFLLLFSQYLLWSIIYKTYPERLFFSIFIQTGSFKNKRPLLKTRYIAFHRVTGCPNPRARARSNLTRLSRLPATWYAETLTCRNTFLNFILLPSLIFSFKVDRSQRVRDWASQTWLLAQSKLVVGIWFLMWVFGSIPSERNVWTPRWDS